MEKVVIIGHSYVRRLARTNFSMGFSEKNRTEVVLKGWIGNFRIALIKHVEGAVDWFLLDGTPDLVILILGTNDLVSDHATSAVDLATRLVEVGKRFLRKGVPWVAIVEVLPRYGIQAFGRVPWMATDIAQDWFFARMVEFNARLKQLAKCEPGIAYLRLKGLHTYVKQFLEDGLHLSLEGRKRFVKALRKGAVVELKKAKPWRRYCDKLYY